MTDDEGFDVTATVTTLLLKLIVENETLRRLVLGMALDVPADRLDADERDMLADVLAKEGKR